MAPEWASNLPITAKVDVYSYGVVLLEIIKGIRVSDWKIEGKRGFYEELRQLVHTLNERSQIEESWPDNFVDPKLAGVFDERQAKVMVEIALSCLEENRNERPGMNSIVDMLLSYEK